jgi:hypothetical protein
MTWLAPAFARSALATAAFVVAVASPAPAAAATASTTGNDSSWPQCGRSFPAGQAFGIVGVNGGLANTLNPCLGRYQGGSLSTSELYWAWLSTGGSAPGLLPKAALYVNTADPGPGVADWPRNNVDPNGTAITEPFATSCTGTDSPACAWQYGWNRAVQDMDWLTQAATGVGVASTASAYRWWLDVETANSWETGTTGLADNVADLQGMVAAFETGAATVGIYSTTSQWNQITGGSKDGNLSGLPDWIPGARRLSGAQANCSLAGFTGPITITQWFGKPYDGDYACKV